MVNEESLAIDNSKKFVRTLAIIVGIVFILVLIVIKINTPSFKLWVLFVAILGIVIFFVGIYYFFNYVKERSGNASDDDQKIPKPITMEQAREIARRTLRNPDYAEYVLGCLGEGVEQRGKSSKNDIYWSKWSGYYDKDTIYVLINMNFPSIRRAIEINPSDIKLENTKRFLANEELIPMKETKLVNAITGIEQTISEPQADKKEEEKEKEKGL